jgi:hypothetical protein
MKTTVALSWEIIFMISIALFTTASSAFGRPVEPRGRLFPMTEFRFAEYFRHPFKAVASSEIATTKGRFLATR